MTKSQFKAQLENQLKILPAGKNWQSALVNEEYICAVVQDCADFEIVKPMLEAGTAYLACASIRHGNQWYYHTGFGQLFGDASDVSQQMAGYYSDVLAESDWYTYYNNLEIRDQLIAENPRTDGESDADYIQRLEELSDEFLPPLHVNEAGFWGDDFLKFSDDEKADGIWSYEDDGETFSVVCVFQEK